MSNVWKCRIEPDGTGLSWYTPIHALEKQLLGDKQCCTAPVTRSLLSIPQHLNMNKLLLFIFILKSLDVSESVVGGRKTKANKYPWLAYLEVLGHDGKVGTFLRFSNSSAITWPGISVWRNHHQPPPHPHCGPLPHGQVRKERKVRRIGQNLSILSVRFLLLKESKCPLWSSRYLWGGLDLNPCGQTLEIHLPSGLQS